MPTTCSLAEPHQAMIDIDADELIADRLVDQNGGHRAVDAARQGAENALLANLLADLGDHLGAIGGHGPVGLQPDDPVHEIGQ